MFIIILNQIIKMLLLMLFGALCYKKKLIDQKGNEMLANLLMLIVNPIMVFMSSQTEYSTDLLHGLIMSYVLAAATHLLMIVLSTVLIKKNGNDDFSIERLSMVYSNCGFIGVPLVHSVLGSEGVLYLSAYMTVFNIFVWTHGLTMMTGKTSLKDMLKGLMTPALFACVSGLIFFICQIHLPDIFSDTLNYISGMNTPIAMMIAGISVAQTDIPAILRKGKVIFNAFCKLAIMPALVLVIIVLTRRFISANVAYTTLIAAACPTGGSCTAFALMFHKNYKYASEMHVFTTLCCSFTIPLFVFAVEHILA